MMEELDNNNDDKLNKIIRVIKDSYHPTIDELGNYILFKSGIEPENKSILKLAPKIELHIRKCSECNKVFLELNSEYAGLDNFLKIEESNKEVKIPETVIVSRKFINFRYTGIALLFACILYLGAFSISRYTTPTSLKYASLENRSDLYETRGRTTHDFQESLKALEKRDNEDAVKWLNQDIVNNRGDETIFYSYYVLGLTNLESAQKDILGLFPSYDKSKVNEGIAALNKALEMNNSGKFRNINFDIYFFLGKADLMLNNKTGAKEYLTKVINEKGSKMNEAKNILAGLD
jgi:tetratricopeptide (TPR) repeat protein